MKFDSYNQSGNLDGWDSFYEVMPHHRSKFKEEWSDAATWGSKENSRLVIRTPEFKGCFSQQNVLWVSDIIQLLFQWNDTH